MIEVSDEDIRKYTKMIFKRAFSLGAFYGCVSGTDKAYNMMMGDIENNASYTTDGVKKIVERLAT